MKYALTAMLFAAVFAMSCSSSSSKTANGTATSGATNAAAQATGSAVPSNTVWLCKPGIANNPCEGDLTATVIHADGSTSIETAQPAKNPPIDCFYVYPTASTQPTANADLSIDPAEINVARLQVARFSQQCRVFAPIYRQLTVAGLFGRNLPEGSAKPNPEEAYQDVVSAWKDYLMHDNDGRGFVLIGHSQGSFELTRLIREQIDNNPPVRGRLVSAIVLGGNVTVLDDAASGAAAVVTAAASGGASFAHIPACTASSQLGCVVAYSSFPSMPPANAIFGRVGGAAAATSHVLCTNPAALGGGAAPLHAYLPAEGSGLTGFGDLPKVTTPWIAFPDEFTGGCMSGGGASWLQIDDARSGTAAGSRLSEPLGSGWGYHLLDANLTQGNLVDLVGQESKAWQVKSSGR